MLPLSLGSDHIPRGAAWTVVALCVTLWPLAAQPLEVGSTHCEQAHPSEVPYYTVSGTWNETGDQLYLVDPERNIVLTYSESGRNLGTLPTPAVTLLDDYFPSTIKRYDNQLVVELATRDLVFLDNLFRPRRRISVSPRKPLANLEEGSVNTQTLESMFIWEFVGNEVMACGDIRTLRKGKGDLWQSAIVRFPLEGQETLTEFAPSDFRSPEWLFCRLGLPFIAAIGDTGFVYLPSDRPGVYRSVKGAIKLERLDQFPAERASPPALTDFTSPDELTQTMAEVSQASMPAGLYGWSWADPAASNVPPKASLFMLYRRAESRSTTWELLRLDPSTGKVLERARIGSHADHLQVIPGSKKWLFLEKGPVQFREPQRIESFLFVPAKVFQSKLPDILCPQAGR
jgi:hypothetical protein